MVYFLDSDTPDAYTNLARDELILNELRPGDIALYLYVNGNAVIIGRNQNPLIECNMAQLDADNVQLVRRVSGGGAVYHDSGNLNYSFIASAEIYDEARQTGVIMNALKSFGIECEVSGRNDLTVQGHKFSGNAFCGRGGNRQHHGTLLISSRLGVFARYLTAPKQKLEAKGVKSVRARVCNLNEFNPDITVESMKCALKQAFEGEYGPASPFAADETRVAVLREQRKAWEWRIGETPSFDCMLTHRFAWGTAEIGMNVQNGIIRAVRVYTDSLDVDIPERIGQKLIGMKFDEEEIISRL